MALTTAFFVAASTAASSSPDQPPQGGLCAIHQPNLFPRLGTLAKIFSADQWIVLDNVQFARRDYQHRTRLAELGDADRQCWLSLPTHLPSGRSTLIGDARLADPVLSARRTGQMVHQHYRRSPHWNAVRSVLSPVLDAFTVTDRTAVIAEASTRALLDLLGWDGQILRSSEIPARPGRTQRLADLAAFTNTGSYLCGPGGMRYLEPAYFSSQGVTVTPFRVSERGVWGPGVRVTALWALAEIGPAALAAEFHSVAEQHRTRP